MGTESVARSGPGGETAQARTAPAEAAAAVDFKASVPATGTITITDTVTCPGAAGATIVVLGAVTLATPGAGSLVVSSSSLPCIGLNSLVASYPGDSHYSAGMSQPLVETVLAQFTPTETDLNSPTNPSVPGQAVVFTAVLKYTAQNTFPTGVVTFTDTNTGTALGTAAVFTTNLKSAIKTTASITTTLLTAGSYAVQAAYSGDNVYFPSDSQIVIQVVGAGVPPSPKITSVVTTQGMDASQNSNIAENTWVEIHGSNLAPATQDWSNQDFSKGLPTSLGAC